MNFSCEIKQARIDKGWKQQDLQAATGLSQKYLSQIELDKVDPRRSIVKRIAHALAVSLDTLAKDEDAPGPEPEAHLTLAAATPPTPSRQEAKPARTTARRVTAKASMH